MTRVGPVLLLAALAASCGPARPRPVPPPPPQLPEVKRAARGHAVVDWFWESVVPDTGGAAGPRPVELPAQAASIMLIDGGARVWDELGDVGRERLRADGIVVLGAAPGDAPLWRMSALYMNLRERRIPSVVTLDALFALVHDATSIALAELEERELAPLLGALLAKLDARLSAEGGGASPELRAGYRLDLGLLAVARVLLDPTYAPPPGLADVVREEQRRVEAHRGPEPSALLGVPIDYARFAVPPASAHPGAARAIGWLSSAPLALVARSEVPGAPVDVSQARTSCRAAMILARLSDPEVDPAIAGALGRLTRLFSFLWGRPDDATPTELRELAGAAGIDLDKPDVIANVVAVDKLRAIARATRPPTIWDGSGGAGAAGASVRLFGAHASLEMASFAARAAKDHAPPPLVDLARWFASGEAKERASGARLHASTYGSLLDVLLAWSASGARGQAASRARAESILAAWTLARHPGQPFAQPKPRPLARVTTEADGAGDPPPVLVVADAAPLGHLLAAVRQIHRGLAALGPLAKGAPADAALAEAEALVAAALRASERGARGEPLDPAESAALASFAARAEALEEAAGDPGPHAVVVLAEPAEARALVSSTGVVEPAIVLVRDPGTGRPTVAVGAHLAHHESLEPAQAARPSPAQTTAAPAMSLERRARAGEADRASWTVGFRMARSPGP